MQPVTRLQLVSAFAVCVCVSSAFIARAEDAPATQPAAIAPAQLRVQKVMPATVELRAAAKAEIAEAAPIRAEAVAAPAAELKRVEAAPVETTEEAPVNAVKAVRMEAVQVEAVQAEAVPLEAVPARAVEAVQVKRVLVKPQPAAMAADPAGEEAAARAKEAAANTAHDAAVRAKEAAVRDQTAVQRVQAKPAPVAVPAPAAVPANVKPAPAAPPPPSAPTVVGKEGTATEARKDDVKKEDVKKESDAADKGGEVFEGASVRWQSLNRNASVQLDSGQTTHNISLNGQVSFPAGVKVLGVGNETVLAEALDQDGNSMLQNRGDIVNAFKGRVARRNMYFQAPNMNNGVPMGYANINLNQVNAKPTKIKSITGYCLAVVAGKTETKVIEAKASKDFAKLIDNAEVRVDQYQVQNENYANVTITIRKPGNTNDGYAGMMQPPVVAKLELVDDQGNASNAQYVNMNYQGGNNNQIMVSHQANFQTSEAGALANAKTIRITIATQVVEKKIPFELKDIPLP